MNIQQLEQRIACRADFFLFKGYISVVYKEDNYSTKIYFIVFAHTTGSFKQWSKICIIYKKSTKRPVSRFWNKIAHHFRVLDPLRLFSVILKRQPWNRARRDTAKALLCNKQTRYVTFIYLLHMHIVICTKANCL